METDNRLIVFFIVLITLVLCGGVWIYSLHTKQSDIRKEMTAKCKDENAALIEDKQSLSNKLNDISEKYNKQEGTLGIYSKNIYGAFENKPLQVKVGSCVGIADKTKGDFTVLQEDSSCKQLFTYEPVQQQIKTNDNKCVESFNEQNIILGNCNSASIKQKYKYYPLFDGKFKSLLYSKCLGANKDGFIELQSCNLDSTLKMVEELYLPNA